MDRRRYLGAIGAAAVASTAGCLGRDSLPEPQDIESRVTSGSFRTRREGEEWRDLPVHGVNLGMAKPGRFPGEAAITKAEYARWLEGISEMNANVIRMYTLHPPGFYEALAEHNEEREEPLFVLHGNWIAEPALAEAGDAFDDSVVEIHRQGIEEIVDAVHGDLSVSERVGQADGTYRADVSPYVLGYVIGIEWPPEVIEETDDANEGIGDYDGEYVRTEDATPFEHWLAKRLDEVTAYEDEQYDETRPLSFTNWPTADHLEHPAEPLEEEDLVSVTANHHRTTDAFDRGLFATYHVYPYYPDFLNYEEEYVEYVAEDGERSSYRGYLEDLVDANDHPVLVGEFGVPASRGKTHSHVYGFDQGGHTERQQGEMNVELYEHIVGADTLGGLVFTWQDEWFKRTWNTMDYMNPDRRPFWSDVQTCEQMFGVLGFDPGDEPGFTLSGSPDEWDAATRLDDDPGPSPLVALEDGHDGARTLTGLEAGADERYLHLRVSFDDLADLDWNRANTLLALDLAPGQGNTSLPFETGLGTDRGVDFVVHLAGPGSSRVVVDSYYDVFYYLYAELLESIPTVEYAGERDSGEFHPIELALNRELRIPSQDRTIGFESHETGRLRFGNGDPESPEYDSLSDVHVAPAEDTIEVRLPWLLINLRDPSRHETVADLWEDGIEGRTADGVSVAAATFAPEDPDAEPELSAGDGEATVTDAIGDLSGSRLEFGPESTFEWEGWEEPSYHERRKESYEVIREAFAGANR
ncbi:hypothetical protein [Saliphagus infecundisoli]|uniref:Family 2 glycosyl transferase n=1 Tax=Saliphagus infecundisoli TaxID=1849069 RepID=A0ABD5QJS8_9EURY|nr:hypothetical protein [Saliphagus infecundisoli]